MTTAEIEKEIESLYAKVTYQTLNTIGYAESRDKVEFEKGISIFKERMENELFSLILKLTDSTIQQKKLAERLKSELETISNIILSHKPEPA